MESQARVEPANQVIFDNTIDGLFRALRPFVTPTGKAKIRALGLDMDGKLNPAYPAHVWASAVKIFAADAYPGLAPFEGQRRVAERTVDAFAEGVIGTAMFTLLRLVGPDRTIGRMTRNLRTGSNYVETKATQLEPHKYEIWINDVTDLPGFYLGLLERGLHLVGAKELKIELANQTGPSCTYRVGWKG
ncbi:MAG: DUF2378 family protein [Deltaproteobacteria bacterium]|nr:DUF2378 family protein [Deltaproteobacteria bacterium]